MDTVDWGPVAAWAGAAATVLVVITTSLVALGYFDRFRAPRLRIGFEDAEPWRRAGRLPDGTPVEWVRIGVENTGKAAATGCVGRLIGTATEGDARRDVDPVQLRWAGLPRGIAFDPVDVRPGQREYLNVVCLADGQWRLVTFESPDFDPGFATVLPGDQAHRLVVAVFASNATAAEARIDLRPGGAGARVVELAP